MTISKHDRLNSNSDITSQLSKLNKQLITYKIIDRQGIYRGEIKDIYYDANDELNLLIELEAIDNKISLRRLEPQDICQIDLDKRSLLSSLSYQQLENLPLYQPVPTHLKEALTESSLYDDCEMNPIHNKNQQLSEPSKTYQIDLLEEKLRVTRRKQKLGEVVVRKQIETKIIKVPIRREKLIVERRGKHPEQLAAVVIGEGKVNGFKYEELNNEDSLHITKSHFLEVQTAQELLAAIAHLSSAANAKISIEIVTNCSEHQIEHQHICDRY